MIIQSPRQDHVNLSPMKAALTLLRFIQTFQVQHVDPDAKKTKPKNKKTTPKTPHSPPPLIPFSADITRE